MTAIIFVTFCTITQTNLVRKRDLKDREKQKMSQEQTAGSFDAYPEIHPQTIKNLKEKGI